MHRDCLPSGTLLKIRESEYIIGKTIGWGGSALVYEARTSDGKSVAIKEIYPKNNHVRVDGQVKSKNNQIAELDNLKSIFDTTEQLISNEMAKKNYQVFSFADAAGEAKLLYPGSQDVWDVKNHYAIMTDLAEQGQTLKEYIQTVSENSSKRSLDEILKIMDTILDAYSKLHDDGFIHGDCKPSNLFLLGAKNDIAKTCYIIDFTTGRKLDACGKTTPITDGNLYATDGYMAPEFLNDRKKDDFCLKPSYDVWALGYIFLELLRGCLLNYRTEFVQQEDGDVKTVGEPMKDLFWKEDDSDRIGESAAIKSYINQILMKAMDNEPDKRYQNAREMQDDLQMLRRCLDLDLGQDSKINEFFLWEASRRFFRNNPKVFLTTHKPRLVKELPLQKIEMFGCLNGKKNNSAIEILTGLVRKKENIYFYGPGGSGKSFVIAELMYRMFSEGQCIPIYLDLGYIKTSNEGESYNKDDTGDIIFDAIIMQYFNKSIVNTDNQFIEVKNTIKEIFENSETNEMSFLLILDNLHKINTNMRDYIAEMITAENELYKSSSIIIIGRSNNFQIQQEIKINNQVELLPIPSEDIIKYFRAINVFMDDSDAYMLQRYEEVLGRPMFLMLALEIYAVSNRILDCVQKIPDILLHYFDSYVYVNSRNKKEHEILEALLPWIAYNFFYSEELQLSRTQLDILIKKYPYLMNQRISVDDFINSAVVNLAVLYKNNNGNFEFVHDCYQEYFAGMQIAKAICNVNQRENLEFFRYINDAWPIEIVDFWSRLIEIDIENNQVVKINDAEAILIQIYYLLESNLGKKLDYIKAIPYNISYYFNNENRAKWRKLGSDYNDIRAIIDKARSLFVSMTPASDRFIFDFADLISLLSDAISERPTEIMIYELIFDVLYKKFPAITNKTAKTNIRNEIISILCKQIESQNGIVIRQVLQFSELLYADEPEKQKNNKLVDALEKLSDDGSIDVQISLAKIYVTIPEKFAKAIYLIENLCNKHTINNTGYIFAIGQFYKENISHEKTVLFLEERLQDHKNRIIADWLGELYYNGDGVKQDKMHAIALWESYNTVENEEELLPSSITMRRQLANDYFYGCGIDKNLKKANFWMKQTYGGDNSSFSENQNSCFYKYEIEEDYKLYNLYGLCMFSMGLYSDAFRIFKMGSDKNDAISNNNLACYYSECLGEMEQSEKLLIDSIKQNNVFAHYNLGQQRLLNSRFQKEKYGYNVEEEVEAVNLLVKAATLNNVYAIKELTNYFRSNDSYLKDDEMAEFWAGKVKNNRDYNKYQTGNCTKEDLRFFLKEKQKEWENEALKIWDLSLEEFISDAMKEKIWELKHTSEITLMSMIEEAQNGSKDSQYLLGVYYASKEIVDWSNALYWFEKASQSGEAKADLWCANVLLIRWGVKSDFHSTSIPTKVFQLVEKAAQKGNVLAQIYLSYCYYYGENITKDKMTAFFWLKEAARLGDKFALNKLFCLERNGEDISNTNKDLLCEASHILLAYNFTYGIDCDRNIEKAIDCLDKIRSADKFIVSSITNSLKEYSSEYSSKDRISN